jgi:hypothetical protein
MKLTEKQLKYIIKESIAKILNEADAEGIKTTNARTLLDSLSDFLYSNGRKASYLRKELARKSYFSCSTNDYGEHPYEEVPPEVIDAVEEAIGTIEAAVDRSVAAIMSMIQAGLLTDYEIERARRAIESTNH